MAETQLAECLPLLNSSDDPSVDSGMEESLPVSFLDTTVVSSDVLSFDCSLSSPTRAPAARPPSLSPSASQRSDLSLHLSVPEAVPPPAPPVKRNIQDELRDLVDDMLRKKKDAKQLLEEENASLRAQLSLLKDALTKASSQPGSEIADVLSALDRERSLRESAEESRISTGKFLAEQVETVSKQKAALESELRDFTHGCEFWREKAIAALERCEELEEENVRVKTQLNSLARKQASVFMQQVDNVLREVAEERERLKLLEEGDTLTEIPGTQSKQKSSTPKPEDQERSRRIQQASRRIYRAKAKA